MIIEKNELPSEISEKEIAELKSLAKESPKKRARILMHHGHDDLMQEMVIAIDKDSYVMPHKQVDRIKTYIVMEGSILLAFFGGDGEVKSLHKLSCSEGGKRIIRFDTNEWHTVVSLSDMCVYVEIAQGPFEGSQWVDWAPTDEKSQEALEFTRKLRSLEPE